MKDYEVFLTEGVVIARILPARDAEKTTSPDAQDDADVSVIGSEKELIPGTPEFKAAVRLATRVHTMEVKFRRRWIPEKEGEELLRAKNMLRTLGVPSNQVHLAFVPQDRFSAAITEVLDDLPFEHASNLQRLNRVLAPKSITQEGAQESERIIRFPVLQTDN